MSLPPSEVSEELINSFRRKKKTVDCSQQTEENILQRITELEQDCHRRTMENIKLQNALKLAQDNLAVFANNQNNTSSSFMLPSEFKNKWEQMVNGGITNAFLSLCNHPLLMVNIVQYSCLYIQNKVNEMIKEKTSQIAKILGIDGNCNSLAQQLNKMFQDNHNTSFPYSDTVLEGLSNEIKQQATRFMHSYSENEEQRENMKQDFDDWFEGINNEDMRDWIQQFWLLLLYINLSDQNLYLGYDKVNFRFVEFKKTDYYLIDGFGTEGSPAIIVVPYVQNKNKTFAYHGLKHAVIILQNDQKNLEQFLNERERNPIPEMEISVEIKNNQLTQQSSIQNFNQFTETDRLNEKIEDKTFQSQRSSKPVDDDSEFRIKPQPQKSLQKSVVQQMKDTLDVISKLENAGMSFDASRTLQQSERFYMQRILRTQNSRIEENSSFLGKINSSLAGKIVHQKSVHIEEQKPTSQLITENTNRQVPNSSRLYKNPRFNKENIQQIPPEKRDSLEKLMKSFCQKQRQQSTKLQPQHSRAQSNEQRVFKNIVDNFSSDEENAPTVCRLSQVGPRQKKIGDSQLTSKLFMQKLQRRDCKV